MTTRNARAYAVVFRYHLGSVISGGFFITLVAPIHGTLGVMAQMADDQENWLGVIFAGGRMGIVDYYNRVLRCITRDAFFDVSLQGMGFCEAASHSQNVTENEANMLSVLTGATRLFKLAGIGSATACAYYSVLFFICANPAHRDHKSDQYLPNPGLLCMVGLVVGCLVCLPFMQLFDVVSDSILFCKTVKHQRRRHRAGIIDRACASGMTNWFDEVAGCHCGSRPSQEGPSSSSWFLSGSRSSKKTKKNKQGDLTSQGLE